MPGKTFFPAFLALQLAIQRSSREERNSWCVHASMEMMDARERERAVLAISSLRIRREHTTQSSVASANSCTTVIYDEVTSKCTIFHEAAAVS